ncbi:MAG: hypothetical protein ACAH07_00250 [Methylophilaceae bacterium]|nr:hypothetical protein [Methyloradius sp.]
MMLEFCIAIATIVKFSADKCDAIRFFWPYADHNAIYSMYLASLNNQKAMQKPHYLTVHGTLSKIKELTELEVSGMEFSILICSLTERNSP